MAGNTEEPKLKQLPDGINSRLEEIRRKIRRGGSGTMLTHEARLWVMDTLKVVDDLEMELRGARK